mgnify:CR=1 FL=1
MCMTQDERRLCEKMARTGFSVMFRGAGHKLVFANPQDEITKEQYQRMRSAGVEIANFNDGLVYYYTDEWALSDGEFFAQSEVVKSIPIFLEFDNKLGIDDLSPLKCVAQTVDLTDFLGVVNTDHLTADQLIIGNDVRYDSQSNIITFVDAAACGEYYAERLLGKRDYLDMNAQAKRVRIIGDEPIMSMGWAFCHSCVTSLDMLETDLSKCKSFLSFCRNAHSLQEVHLGKITEGVICNGAFSDSGLPASFNENTLNANEIEKLSVAFTTKPMYTSMVDEENFKIIVANMEEDAIKRRFNDYEIVSVFCKSKDDSYKHRYKFLFRKGVGVHGEVFDYIWDTFPRMDRAYREKLQNAMLKLNGWIS